MRECGRGLYDLCLWLVLAVAFAAVFSGVYWIRFEGAPHAALLRHYWQMLPIVVLVKLAMLYVFKLHRLHGHDAGFHPLLRLAKATVLASLLVIALDSLLFPELQTPRSVSLLDLAATFGLGAFLLGLSRSICKRNLLADGDLLCFGTAPLGKVSLEDLLQREPVQLETNEIQHWLQGKTILVTGSAGSIGSEICRQLLKFSPARLILVDRNEFGQFSLENELRAGSPEVDVQVWLADVGDSHRMRQLLKKFQPEVLFHAAAYKHVPLLERQASEAVKNNIIATRSLADLAHELRLEAFVMVSTDKAVNPTSVMGACKRVAELYVQSKAVTSSCRFVTVRFGNVLGSSGSVVPIFLEQIKHGGPVTITDPRMRRFFMTIPEAAQLVIQAGCMGGGGEIFVLDMGVPIRIIDLAHDLIRRSGLTPGRDIRVETVGLRPGEKLSEELHVAGEVHLPTRHPRIVVAQSNQEHRMDISHAILELQHVVEQRPQHVLAMLQAIVPQYQPSGTEETFPMLAEATWHKRAA